MPPSPKNFIILEKVDSTNNYAMGMVQKGSGNSGDAVFALEQSAGRGRREKTWTSTKGNNIMLSILMEMQWLSVSHQFRLSVAVSLACHDFFFKYSEHLTPRKADVKIKWPNDIFINDSKAGGILIENVIRGNIWQWSVIGIGLNINQEGFVKNGLRATSLKEITGETYDVVALARELHEAVLLNITDLQNGACQEMLADYNQNLYASNKTVKLKKGNVVFETVIQSISSSGELITKDTIERNFGFDEVEWVTLPLTPTSPPGGRGT
ncbi:MAG: biotin--[acetyl-CoA-carboxylase] ligase [Ginsengibacter sp.]